MIPTVILRSICLLAWLSLIQPNDGFQFSYNSPCQRQRRIHSATAFVTHQRSSRLTRRLSLEAIWGGGSSASSSSDSGDSETEGEEIAEETTEEDDAAAAASTSADEEPSTDVVAAAPSAAGSEKSLLTLMNEIGNNFQSLARKATETGSQTEDQYKKILYAAKACLYYTLFILYRSYRGFFVLLPATFMQVYRKMETAMTTGNLSLEEIGYTEGGEDPANKPTKLRTKFTISILTTVITISYILSGILKMGSKFIKTIAKTSNVPKSFAAAADEALNFEGQISRVGKVNGGEEEDASPSSLMP